MSHRTSFLCSQTRFNVRSYRRKWNKMRLWVGCLETRLHSQKLHKRCLKWILKAFFSLQSSFLALISFGNCPVKKAKESINKPAGFCFLSPPFGKRVNTSVSGATGRELMANTPPSAAPAFPRPRSSCLYAHRAWSCWLWHAICGAWAPAVLGG